MSAFRDHITTRDEKGKVIFRQSSVRSCAEVRQPLGHHKWTAI